MTVNIVNKATLDAIGKNIGITFQKGRDNFTNDLVNVLYNERMTNLPTQVIASLDGYGLMREFKSERQPGVIGEAITVATVKKFERTIDIKREDIEDDNIGYAQELANSVGIASARTPYAEVVKVLTQGFTVNLADGAPFFSNTRGNLQTGALTEENLAAAILKLESQKDAEGQPLGFKATTLIVGPQNRAAAAKIIKATQVSGTTNIYYNALNLVVSQYITDDSWYVVDGSEGTFPIILLMRVRPDKIVARTEDNSDRAFDKDIYSWGTRGRFVAAYHNPKLIVGSAGA